MRSTSLSKLSVIICFFVCLFVFFCKTNKLRAIWVERLGTLAKKTLALKVEVEVVLLYVKPWLHPFDNWHWKVKKKKKKRKRKEKEWKERNFARLKYKNHLNRRALLTADEILSVCMRATSTRTNSRILKKWSFAGCKASFYHFLSKRTRLFLLKEVKPWLDCEMIRRLTFYLWICFSASVQLSDAGSCRITT